MRKVINVELHERAVLAIDKRPVEALGPGKHVRWTLRDVGVVRYDTRTIVVRGEIPAEHQALLGEDVLATVAVGDNERVLVKRRGKAHAWLGTGTHLVWLTDRIERRRKDGVVEVQPGIELVRIDTSAVAAKPLTDDVRALVPAGDYAEVVVPDGTVALRMVEGAITDTLQPGRHAAWTCAQKVTHHVVDLKERVLQVAGQEVMTRDKVTLRVNASVTVKTTDPVRLVTVARNADEAVYLAMQLALREQVQAHALDALLAERELLAEAVRPAVAARAENLGLAVVELGVKDLILPGEMKALLNRVIEAQKAAEANVILRREETAATRSMANTAKVLGENPLLMRLKELETYKDLAHKVGKVHVVLGAESLQRLELKT
jgi:regulator of protease activity HflC (stomatin/prohibitin superfamily)